MYHKPTFTGQYLNFNSHHPYTVKKGIGRCLQHRAKTISSDTDAYQEEMISLRHNLHRNNYPERITSAPRNLDRRIEDNTRKLTMVCLPYIKGLPERIQKICSPYNTRTVFTSGSTLRRYLFRVKPPTEFNIHPCIVVSNDSARTWTAENRIRMATAIAEIARPKKLSNQPQQCYVTKNRFDVGTPQEVSLTGAVLKVFCSVDISSVLQVSNNFCSF